MASSEMARKGETATLPDDVFDDILSRLPVKSIFQYRCVSKALNALTRTPGFEELNLRRSTPSVLVHDVQNRYKMEPFLLKLWWGTSRRKPKIQKLSTYHVQGPREFVYDGFSQDGLIVLKCCYFSRHFIIFNPLYHEQIKINLPGALYRSGIMAVFFHPVLKEYCTLWRVIRAGPTQPLEEKNVRYKMLNLGSEPSWKEVTNPWIHKSMLPYTSPVYNDGFIYWMVEDENILVPEAIMAYDVKREKFAIISHPCPKGLNSRCVFYDMRQYDIRLLNFDGVVSLVHIKCLDSSLIEIDIWRLKDHETESWMKTTYMATSGGVSLISYPTLQAISAVDGMLVFQGGDRLFLCNLNLQQVTEYGRKKYNKHIIFWAHNESLTSLRNCNSEIDMEDYIEAVNG